MNSVIDINIAMTQLEQQNPGSRKTNGIIYPTLKIDMTPMVDLGFLLITFFIFTTTMSDKTTMKLYMPHDGPHMPVGETKVLTVLLGHNNKVYAYEGSFEKALKQHTIISTNYNVKDGIGNLIRSKQKQLQQKGVKNSKDDLLLIIKPTEYASYKNVIDALDEATINGVKKYMLLDATAEENYSIEQI